MTDSSMKVKELYPQKKSRLPLLAALAVGFFVATILVGGAVIVDEGNVQLTADTP